MDALSELRFLGHRVTSTSLWAVCAPVLEDPRFLEGIASASHHPDNHQVPGGLVVHTWEVAKAAVEMAGADKVLAARAFVTAVFHDYGKIHEYEWLPAERKVKKLPFGLRIGHVVWSWEAFLLQALRAGLEAEDQEEIGHAMLAHMGRREWGSPVEPQTRLAFIIHTADMLSARGLVR